VARAKKRSATPSSMATRPKIVVVKGPLVLFSQRTSVVAAGAVAEEIAPSKRPRERASFILPANRKYPAKVIRPSYDQKCETRFHYEYPGELLTKPFQGGNFQLSSYHKTYQCKGKGAEILQRSKGIRVI
jgi:hypothetical protein